MVEAGLAAAPTQSSPHDCAAPRRIAVLALAALGDTLLTLPFLHALRAAYPGDRIDLLVSRTSTQLMAEELHACGAFPVDRVVMLKSAKQRSLKAAISAGLELRFGRYDIVLQTFSSHGRFADVCCMLSGATICGGFRTSPLSRAALNTAYSIKVRRGVHFLQHNLDLATALGVLPPVPDSFAECLLLLRQGPSTSALDPERPLNPPYLILSTYADPRLQAKRWPREKWAQLGRLCFDAGFCSIVIGAPTDREDARQLCEAIGPGARNEAGQTSFARLAWLMAEAAVIVGSDGMPLHFADALGLPVVGLFGPTDPAEVGPFNAAKLGSLILRAPGDPVYTNATIGVVIPASGSSQMDRIEVDDVFKAVVLMAARRIAG